MRPISFAFVTLSLLPLAAQTKPQPEAFVPNMTAVNRIEAAIPEAAREQGLTGPHFVRVLATIDAAGFVTAAEALSGPQALRQAAIDTVRQRQFTPVIRNGHPIASYTDQSVQFTLPGKLQPRSVEEDAAAVRRVAELQEKFPRTPQLEFEDMDREFRTLTAAERYTGLSRIAKAAWAAGEIEKASAYANELLATTQPSDRDWNYGNAVHDANMVLGLVELSLGDLTDAGRYLREAGKTPGSPQLNSFGPNMTLAKELVAKGERAAVLEYFELCRTFWKMGGERLDKWSATVRAGGMPDFQANLVY